MTNMSCRAKHHPSIKREPFDSNIWHVSGVSQVWIWPMPDKMLYFLPLSSLSTSKVWRLSRENIAQIVPESPPSRVATIFQVGLIGIAGPDLEYFASIACNVESKCPRHGAGGSFEHLRADCVRTGGKIYSISVILALQVKFLAHFGTVSGSRGRRYCNSVLLHD